MNKIIVAILVLFAARQALAFDTRYNPDVMASVGFDLIKMQQGAMPRAGVNGTTTDGQGVGAKLDYRLPVTNAFTFHAAAETVTFDNNLEYTDGYRIELGGRVYFGGR